MSLYIGMLSGTSMDGIDVALMDSVTNVVLHGATSPFPMRLRNQLGVLITEKKKISASEFALLDKALGEAFADSCIQFMHENAIQPSDIKAIGFHGQTLCHSPFSGLPYTLQAGCPHTVSVRTNLPTIADFRRRDMALGGQGAPLAPIFHNMLFQQRNDTIAVVNIGGVANISLLDRDGTYCGFDTGPGNVLMDAWVQRHTNQKYDSQGEWGARGRCIPALFERCSKVFPNGSSAPMSFDKTQFSLMQIEKYIADNYAKEDVQATFAHLTVNGITEAILGYTSPVGTLYICGGGAENHLILELLTKALPKTDVRSIQFVGIDPLFVEAQMFAWFAHMRIRGERFDLSGITGAAKAQYLGVIYE